MIIYDLKLDRISVFNFAINILMHFLNFFSYTPYRYIKRGEEAFIIQSDVKI